MAYDPGRPSAAELLATMSEEALTTAIRATGLDSPAESRGEARESGIDCLSCHRRGNHVAGPSKTHGPVAGRNPDCGPVYDPLLARTGAQDSYHPGDDGEHQAGVSVSPRFIDNLDGTVTDNLTGLIWLRNADCFGRQDWYGSLAAANGLRDAECGLTDGSAAGDWRLPNVKELQSLCLDVEFLTEDQV